MSSHTSLSDRRRVVSRPAASRSSRFHLPVSPQRKPIDPRGATTLPDFSSKATVFHSGLLDSPSEASKSDARTKRSGTYMPSRFTSCTSIGMSVYCRT